MAPAVGALIIIFLLIGFILILILPYLTRETRVGEVEVLGDDEVPTVNSDLFLHHMQLLTNGRLYDGNKVEILLNGDGTYDRIIEELGKAQKSISWHVFFYRRGELADRIREALIERAQSGVRVNFLYDYFGADGLDDDDYLEGMKDADVRVSVFRPLKWNMLFKLGQRMHVRSVVIDGKVAFTGGFGIDDRWLGDGKSEGSWRDTNVRIEGPAVDQLQAAFVANWAEATACLMMGDDLFDDSDDQDHPGEDRIGVMHTDPSMGSTNAERFFVLALSAARKKIYITTPYFVPDDDFRTLMCKSAREGVDIRILTPGNNTDQRPAFYAGRAHFAEMLKAGIRLFDYDPTMIHAKTMVVDGEFGYVGTINFDNRSMMLNDEVAMVYSSERIGSELETIYLEDLERSTEINLEEFEKRGIVQRALEQLSRIVSHIL